MQCSDLPTEAQVVKANKGMILRKSVDYIRYLQQLVSVQGARNRELEAELRAVRGPGSNGSSVFGMPTMGLGMGMPMMFSPPPATTPTPSDHDQGQGRNSQTSTLTQSNAHQHHHQQQQHPDVKMLDGLSPLSGSSDGGNGENSLGVKMEIEEHGERGRRRERAGEGMDV